ncbi:MAG: hypothetical protein ACD_60C00025G0057 [uncultured bacterium]|nr:MAG: hypothetical protein ACD_60C00025G0057 [uncultured bacterium]
MESRIDPEKIPNIFLCPITQELFINPFITPCGHTFEEKEIKEWVKENSRCGCCEKKLFVDQLTPNFALKESMALWEKLYHENEHLKKLLPPLTQLEDKGLEEKKSLPIDKDMQENLKRSLAIEIAIATKEKQKAAAFLLHHRLKHKTYLKIADADQKDPPAKDPMIHLDREIKVPDQPETIYQHITNIKKERCEAQRDFIIEKNQLIENIEKLTTTIKRNKRACLEETRQLKEFTTTLDTLTQHHLQKKIQFTRKLITFTQKEFKPLLGDILKTNRLKEALDIHSADLIKLRDKRLLQSQKMVTYAQKSSSQKSLPPPIIESKETPSVPTSGLSWYSMFNPLLAVPASWLGLETVLSLKNSK